MREVRFHETLEEVPHGRWFFLANEFFDALPIRQFLWSGGRSFVRRIALDEHKEGNKEGNKGGAALRFVRGEPSLLPANLSPKNFSQAKPDPTEAGSEAGSEAGERIVEMSPRALFLAASVASQLAEHGGAAFVCDYGYLAPHLAPRAGSLQAFYRHKAVDPLTHIGACDLSAEVDFAALLQTFEAALGKGDKGDKGGYGGECCVQTQRDFLRFLACWRRGG